MSQLSDRSRASVNWPLRQGNALRRLLNLLERFSLALERPIARLVGSPHWNPLYHTGTITLFALLVVLFTGIYLTLFLQFGFVETYQAIAKIETNPLGRFMRALHRYASVVSVVAALLHAWRTLFMDRFRGPRWLAWVSGVLLLVLLWGAGLTGYWLIFDERAQLFNQALIDWLSGSSAGVAFLNRFMLTEAAGGGWLFVLGVLTVHIVLSVVVGLFFYLHIKRLRRAKILPPRYWMALLAAPLLLASIFVPVGMLAPANPAQLPEQIPFDLLLLWFLPAALHLSPAAFWGGVVAVLLLLIALPWLPLRRRLEPALVDAERCTGCTLCAADCPYKAITMLEREPEAAHKFLAVIDPKLCVSCGICVGSCPPLAITLGDQPAEPLWQQTVARAAQQAGQPVRVVFTCERHAQQAARRYLDNEDRSVFGGGTQAGAAVRGRHVEVIPLPCIGMAHPDLARDALKAGAADVQFIGCPPEDCANREGNLWLQARVERQRLPRLRREVPEEAVITAWQAPNDFGRALQSNEVSQQATSYAPLRTGGLSARNLVPALGLLAVVMALSVASSVLPYRPFAANEARAVLNIIHSSGYPVVPIENTATLEQKLPDVVPVPVRVQVEMDGVAVLEKTYPLRKDGAEPVQIFEQWPVPVGDHQVRVLLYDSAGQTAPTVVLDRMLSFAPRSVAQLSFKDARLAADPRAGEKLFKDSEVSNNAGCTICHSLQPGVKLVGPSLAGVATRAATRVPGLSAEDYLMQSLVTPDAYVVEGFHAGQMRPDLAKVLTLEQLEDLVAFLMTLK